MSLIPLEWRKLPVRTLQATQSANALLNNISDMLTGSVYFDGSTRVAGSGSAWSASFKFTTGSNTEAIVCFPPLMTEISQSVIFAGRATGNAGGSSSAAAPTASLENVSVPNFLYAAVVKGTTGSAFTQWTSAFPFGSSSFSTGYTQISLATNLYGLTDKITMYESKEAIAVSFYRPSTAVTNGVIAGAIVDPEQSDPTSSVDAEIDGRLYGFANFPAAGLSATFMAAATTCFTHANSAASAQSGDQPRFVLFQPGNRFTMGVTADKHSVGLQPSVRYTTISGKFVDTAIKCVRFDDGTVTSYIGRLRDITLCKNTPTGYVIRDNTTNTISGYILGANETTANNAVMFNHT
jgi:hypothetical protein